MDNEFTMARQQHKTNEADDKTATANAYTRSVDIQVSQRFVDIFLDPATSKTTPASCPALPSPTFGLRPIYHVELGPWITNLPGSERIGGNKQASRHKLPRRLAIHIHFGIDTCENILTVEQPVAPAKPFRNRIRDRYSFFGRAEHGWMPVHTRHLIVHCFPVVGHQGAHMSASSGRGGRTCVLELYANASRGSAVTVDFLGYG
ncbi:hypothetical protein B0H65DRAFT_154464 [Neurospora tetraspora]|uniref:Uncharacterized protein n=1 Tax=Neurospora tetraspora TaxID=94610 RepID=A0AAE0JH42_9PEZI|nr:hypothetical protein B0H65DRAFT_154464 [Neurospora tetraspora]